MFDEEPPTEIVKALFHMLNSGFAWIDGQIKPGKQLLEDFEGCLCFLLAATAHHPIIGVAHELEPLFQGGLIKTIEVTTPVALR
jgi:hypothetical protein